MARSSTTSRAAGTSRSMLSSGPWTIAAPPRGSTWRARCTSAPQHEGYARTARPAAHRRNGGRTSRANTTGSVVWIAGLLGPWPGCTEGVAHPTLSTRPSAAPALLRDAAGRPPPGPRKWSWAVVRVEPSRRVALLPVAPGAGRSDVRGDPRAVSGARSWSCRRAAPGRRSRWTPGAGCRCRRGGALRARAEPVRSPPGQGGGGEGPLLVLAPTAVLTASQACW